MYKIFVNIIFFIFQNLLKRACYSSIMDVPPVPNRPTSFILSQRSFGKANPVKMSFQASWFSTTTWLHHNETYKISSASRAKKMSQSALKSSVRTSGNVKFSRGRSPEPPLREGKCPLSCSPPTRTFVTRKKSLIFHGRTTFQKPTTALEGDTICKFKYFVFISRFRYDI